MQSRIVFNVIGLIFGIGLGWAYFKNYWWTSSTVVAGLCCLIITHLFLTNVKAFNIYIVPMYFILVGTSTIISKKVIFPFIVSPRRFYAKSLGILNDPWRPPGPIFGPIMINFCFISYLYCVTYYCLKLISLRKIGRYDKQIVTKYAIKLSVLSYCVAFIFRTSSTLSSYIDLVVHSLPFKEDLLVGIPAALLSSMIVMMKYGNAIVEETIGSKQKVTIWDMFV